MNLKKGHFINRSSIDCKQLWSPFSMPRCQRKHLKRLAAPHHWMLAKTAGKFATHPGTGPHQLRECLPLIVFLRNRLKYALNAHETTTIIKRRLVKVDGKVRTTERYPAGLMDVIELGKSNEKFRLLYDAKGRFVVHHIDDREAEYKLLRVNKWKIGDKGIPLAVTHDGRTVSYCHPDIRLHDTIKFNLKTHEPEHFIKFAQGNVAMVTAGGNVGRVGVIERIEKQNGGHDIIHMKDAIGNEFATRITNVFVIGEGENAIISLPGRQGVRPSILEGIETE